MTTKLQVAAFWLLVAIGSMLMVTCRPPMVHSTKLCIEPYKEGLANNPAEKWGEFYKCYINCLMEDQGEIKNGVIDTEAVAAGMRLQRFAYGDDTDIDNQINKCKDIRGVNDCDTGFRFYACINEMDKDVVESFG